MTLCLSPSHILHVLIHLLVFGNPQGALKGIIAAAYSLGAILSLPLVPYVNDRFGRRWSIFGGSVIMMIGAIIQGFSVNGESSYH